MSTHLDAPQRAHLARALQARRHRLERQMLAHQQGLSPVELARDALEQDNDDPPQRANDREVERALPDIELHELGDITRAQQRVADGHYGLCLDCGVAISYARLSVEPQALRCVACESQHESPNRKS